MLRPCIFCISTCVVVALDYVGGRVGAADRVGPGETEIYYVKCENCESRGPVHDTTELAINAWNNHPSEKTSWLQMYHDEARMHP